MTGKLTKIGRGWRWVLLALCLAAVSACGSQEASDTASPASEGERLSLAEDFEQNSKWRAVSAGGDCVIGRLGDRLLMTPRPGGRVATAPVGVSPDSALLTDVWQVATQGDACVAAALGPETIWVLKGMQTRQWARSDLHALVAAQTTLSGTAQIQLDRSQPAVTVTPAGQHGMAADDPFGAQLSAAEDGTLIQGSTSLPKPSLTRFWYVVAHPEGRVGFAL